MQAAASGSPVSPGAVQENPAEVHERERKGAVPAHRLTLFRHSAGWTNVPDQIPARAALAMASAVE